MSPETYARLDQIRRHDMLAAAGRSRRVAEVPRAASPARSAPRSVTRAKSVLHHPVAALAALVSAATRSWSVSSHQ